MKDKIKAILKKEAPLIEWSVEDWPHSQKTLWVKGSMARENGEIIKGDCVLGVDSILDEDGDIKLKDFYPIIDLTGKGPAVSSGLGPAEWIGSVIASFECQFRVGLISHYDDDWGIKPKFG